MHIRVVTLVSIFLEQTTNKQNTNMLESYQHRLLFQLPWQYACFLEPIGRCISLPSREMCLIKKRGTRKKKEKRTFKKKVFPAIDMAPHYLYVLTKK
jgi:hypothetical protein